MIEHTTRPDLLFPTGAPLSHVVRDDRYAYIAGHAAADVAGGTEVIGDVAAETEMVMRSIRAMLADLGLGMDRIVRVDVHMTDLDRIRVMNDVYRSFFEEGRYPARTCVEVSKIVGGSSVEITCLARL